ncbi:uncharacterized protein [Bombus fervidus]|uniref:uncharacterized protein n=1 Tax=Bombus fervidus TaxID=203811 RepID=UPI003D18F4B7
MNFILVSLLLGVPVPSDKKLWQNGSEYTFDATIRTISNFTPSYTEQGEYMGSSMSTTLKCRSKEPGRL